jgi:hypothetical protein
MIASLQHSFILVTHDRKLFLCAVESISQPDNLRWVFTDSEDRRHIGPAWDGVLDESQVRALMNHWWATASEV